MDEMQLFRERIRNWARVYRDQVSRGESNLMPVLRRLRASRDGTDNLWQEVMGKRDEADAAVLELAYTRLDAVDRKMIKGYWLLNLSPKRNAKHAGIFISTHTVRLREAESHFMRLVQTIEFEKEN